MMLISLRNVYKSFKERPVLENLNLVLSKGEFVSIIGPSGAGKTTLVRLISGFESLDQGEIILNNRIISSPTTFLPPEKRDIGVVFQDHALWPHMTVYENVAFPLRIKKNSEKLIKEKVRQLLTDVSMERFSDRYPHQLSGGESQRVALARTLIQEPHIIIFDEPLASLDAVLRFELQGLIKRLQRDKHITAIYITHDQIEAMRLSDKIAILENGSIQQFDTPKNLYDHPQSETIARLLGHGMCLKTDQVVYERGDASVRIGDYVFHAKYNTALENTPSPRVFIRPEHVSISGKRAEGLEFEVLECFFKEGHYMILFRSLIQDVILIKQAEVAYTPGEVVTLAIKQGWLVS